MGGFRKNSERNVDILIDSLTLAAKIHPDANETNRLPGDTKMTTKTLTIKGNTFKCPTQLKSEHFKFDGSSKTWSREVNVSENGDIYYGEHLQGDAKSYAHHWACYAKSEVTILVS